MTENACPPLDTDISPQHLASCGQCRQRLAGLQALRARLAEAEREVSLPEGFHERLRARLDRPAPVTRMSWRTWAAPLALAASVAVVSLIALTPAKPDALVADMVDHHETCWAIAPSPGRKEHYQDWLRDHPGGPPPTPLRASAPLRETDRRNCPVGEARGPHLLYLDPDSRQVSLYLLPESKAELPEKPQIQHYRGYTALLWKKAGWVNGLVARENDKRLLDWIDPATALTAPLPRLLAGLP